VAGNARDAGQSVTARALAVLAAFDAAHARLTLSDVARRTGLPLTTVHRLTRELEAWRALERDADGLYRIGLRLWEIGLLAPVASRLREVALPFMQDLYEATRENIHLAVQDGFDALYVEKLTGHRSVPIVSRTGGRLPMHATGVGKALLAFGGEAFIEYYCQRPLERPTRYTIVERGRLLRELAVTRERGYATTSEEMTLGSYSIAMPILDESGVVAAALGVVVRSVRADPAKLVSPLRTAVQGIERRLAETAGDPYPSLIHDVPFARRWARGSG
jgi:DNA-binding IclR family transcriptional regulator